MCDKRQYCVYIIKYALFIIKFIFFQQVRESCACDFSASLSLRIVGNKMEKKSSISLNGQPLFSAGQRLEEFISRIARDFADYGRNF